MSTLNITPRTHDVAAEDGTQRDGQFDAQFDARFDALVRVADVSPAAAPVEFATVFDLDYGERRLALVVPQQRSATSTPQAPRPAVRRAVPRRQRARVRLTRRGRLVAVTTFLGLSLAVLLTLGGFSAVASLDGGTSEPVRVVTVQPGDTLYDIAADLAAPGEIRAMVLRIQELNSLPSASLEEGQKLAVPRG